MARSDSAKSNTIWPERGRVYNTNLGMEIPSVMNWNLITLHWLVGDQLERMNDLLTEQNLYLKELVHMLSEKENVSQEELEHNY